MSLDAISSRESATIQAAAPVHAIYLVGRPSSPFGTRQGSGKGQPPNVPREHSQKRCSSHWGHGQSLTRRTLLQVVRRCPFSWMIMAPNIVLSCLLDFPVSVSRRMTAESLCCHPRADGPSSRCRILSSCTHRADMYMYNSKAQAFWS